MISLPKGISISGSEILRENKNTKCPIDSNCHRHCRRYQRITKDCIGARTQRRTSLGFEPYMNPYSLKIFSDSLLIFWTTWCSRSGLRFCYFGHVGQGGAWGDLQRLWVHVGHLAQGGPPLGSGTNAIFCNPWISSAMAMAMSIYRTLCVLVSFKFHS